MVKDVGGSIQDSIYQAVGNDDSGGGGGDTSNDSADTSGIISIQQPTSSSNRKTRKQSTECYLPCAVSLPPPTDVYNVNTPSHSRATNGHLNRPQKGLDNGHDVSLVSGGYPTDGYPADGYPADGYPADGYSANGYAADGYAVDEMDIDTHTSNRPLRVLVVDDSMNNQAMLEEFFLSQGNTPFQ